MNTHFLNFRIKGGETHQLKFTEDFFNQKMNFWLENPTYQEKLNDIIDAREQCGLVFTMANFTGEGGYLPKKKQIVYEIAPPEITQEERQAKAKRLKEIGDKVLGKDRLERLRQYKKEQLKTKENNLSAAIGQDRKQGKGLTGGFSKF